MIIFTEEEKAAIISQMEREAKEWEEREDRRIRDERAAKIGIQPEQITGEISNQMKPVRKSATKKDGKR